MKKHITVVLEHNDITAALIRYAADHLKGLRVTEVRLATVENRTGPDTYSATLVLVDADAPNTQPDMRRQAREEG